MGAMLRHGPDYTETGKENNLQYCPRQGVSLYSAYQ